MTTMNAFQGSDMTLWDFTDLVEGTVTRHTSGRWDVTGSTVTTEYSAHGTNLTYDANRLVKGGTLNTFGFALSGSAVFEIDGDIGAKKFAHFMNANNAAGLQKLWFKGDDVFNGSSGDDHFLGYRGKDVFNLQDGGSDTAEGGDGNDTFNMGSEFHGTDLIFGGAGFDTVVLTGPYDQMLGTTGIEKFVLKPGSHYSLAIDASSVGSGGLVIDASALKPADGAEIFVGGNKGVTMLGGHGSDSLFGTGGADVLTGGEGNDILKGGGGGDTLTGGKGGTGFVYNDAAESTSTNFDTVVDFHAADDTFFFDNAVTGVHTPVHGDLSSATLDANLESALGKTELQKHGAVLFVADTGTLAGSTFLIVDEGGGAGYQAGKDYVIYLEDDTHLGGLNLSNFGVNA